MKLSYTLTPRLSVHAIMEGSPFTLPKHPPMTRTYATEAAAKAAAKRLANQTGYPVEVTCGVVFIALRTPA